MGLFGRYLPVVFFITLLFILGDSFFSFSNLEELHRYEQLSSHSRDVLLQLDTVQTTITSMETNIRGYIITGNPMFKDAYTASAKTIDSSVQTLGHLVTDNPKQRDNADALEKAADAREKSLATSLALYETGGIESVQSRSTTPGIVTSQQVKNAITRFSNEEKNILTARSNEMNAAYHRIISGITIATALSLLLIMLAYYLAVQELRRRKYQEQRKDEFISLASHELKTPITSQKVYIQLLKKAADRHDDPELHKFVQRIDAQAGRLSELVSELLDISRIQTGKLSFHKEEFDLNELVKDTVESIQGTTRKHTFRTTTTIKTSMLGDRYRLYQVLVNLLTNAIKYSPDGGKIIVKAAQERNNAIISVKDSGIGIAKEHQKKIFDRLYQVEEQGAQTYPGLGIGLYISKEIAEQHGGTIHVESMKGKGSTFILLLPLKGILTKRIRERKKISSQAPKTSPKLIRQ